MNPIYVQVNDKLREEILSGRYEDDQQFLTEREIAEQFGVSRITANKALAALVAEGLLAFRRGVGTFVRPRVLEVDLVRMVSFTQQAISAGRTPSTKVLSFAKIAASFPDSSGSTRTNTAWPPPFVDKFLTAGT